MARVGPEPFPEKSSWLCLPALYTPQQSKISSLRIAPSINNKLRSLSAPNGCLPTLSQRRGENVPREW